MSFLSTLLLGLLMSPAIPYKLPLRNGPLLTDDDNTLYKPYNSPFGIAYKWEWHSQDRMDEDKFLLARLKREPLDEKSPKVDDKPHENILSTVVPKDPFLEDLSDATPYTLDATSAPHTKIKKVTLSKEETTPLADLEQATKGAEPDEDDSTPLSDLEQTTNGAVQTLSEDKTTPTQSRTLVTELPINPTTSEELPVLTSKTSNKDTTLSHISSKDSQDTSSQQNTTNDEVLEATTPKTSPSSTAVIVNDQTTKHYVTSSFPGKPSEVTNISTSLEEKVNTQSIMRQCMLTILILAVVCTIFIISTIALAAKVSSMKQKNKLRHPVNYTEMRCISSLMPDNDQQNKPKPKRLKTFASSVEESDGDNTTLNSFLPDH